jgi:hypothetical protein
MPSRQSYDFWSDKMLPFLQQQTQPFPSYEGLLAMGQRKGPLTNEDVGQAAADMANPSFGLLGTIAGIGSKTASKTAKKAAEIMERKGATRDEIYNKTGWYKGVDDKWRYEVDDSKASFTPRYEGQFGPMSQFMDHSELYAAYPDLANLPVVVKPLPQGMRAGYNPKHDAVSISPDIAPDSSLLHELQHAIQQREGFAGGASLKDANRMINDYAAIPTTDPRKVYKQFAGEVEARNTQRRMNYDPAGRQVIPPWLDYDVPERYHIWTGMFK